MRPCRLPSWLILAVLAASGCSAASDSGAGGAGGVGGFAGYGGSPGWTTSSGKSGDAGVGGVGAPCASNAACASPLSCASVTTKDPDPIFSGGPARGMCTSNCGSDADCVFANALCYNPGNAATGRCVLRCTPGGSADGGSPPSLLGALVSAPLDPGKCLGRDDLRCVDTTVTGRPACLPTCGSDTDCGGRVCDARLAVCVDAATQSKGDATGSACDPTASTNTCAGDCVAFRDGVLGMCSSPCVLGAATISAPCGGIENGLCAFHPTYSGAGDGGYCTRRCATHADCNNPDFWCFHVGSLEGGYCFAALSCPGGQNDCDAAGAANTRCTATPAGPLCVDCSFGGPTFPADAGAFGSDGGCAHVPAMVGDGGSADDGGQ